MDFMKAIDEAKAKSKKRNFIQTVEMIINLRGVDFTKPVNRINIEVELPKGRGKKGKICVFAGDELLAEAQKSGALVIKKDEIEALGENKQRLKKIVKEYDFFIAQADLMPLIGKVLGQVMGPKGKLPKPVPGTAKLGGIIKKLQNIVQLRSKGKFLPTLQVPIGTEEMEVADLSSNADAVFTALTDKLPARKANIKSIYFKTSMGPAIKVGLK